MLGPKKDKYKVCSLLDKAHPNFWVQAAEDSRFCHALRYQNRSKGLVWHYINIDAIYPSGKFYCWTPNLLCQFFPDFYFSRKTSKEELWKRIKLIRDHPWKTSANLHYFWPLTPTVCSNGFYADIWSQRQVQQYKSCLKSFL